MPIRKDDRVWHKSDRQCTGTVIDISTTMAQVLWDVTARIYNGENPSWWFLDELIVIPYSTPPPKLIPNQDLVEPEQYMSQAIWCDKGGHAFSAKDPDREHYTSTKNITEGQRVTQVTMELDICGKCVKESVLMEAPALTASVVQDKVPGQA